jgi:signal transduction histidine kinase
MSTGAVAPARRVEPLLVRLGLHEHTVRQLAATPALRVSWFVSIAAALGFSSFASNADPRTVTAFLVLAPLFPVAGVAAAYGPWADPMFELTRSAPASGLRTLLLRTVAVLLCTTTVLLVATALFPAADLSAASWLLPSLALVTAVLALSTFLPTTLAACAIAAMWVVTVSVAALRSGDALAAFRSTGQVVFLGVTVAAALLLAWRRRHLDIQGRERRREVLDAADAERRRIERNLHDGAQQQLVAIGVKAGLAEMLIERDPRRAAEVIRTIRGDAEETLQTMRELTRGSCPPILADNGLVVALAQLAKRSPVPVSLETSGIDRYAEEVETAVYFCCAEALQNVAKYARASRVRLGLTQVGRELSFSVADDGAGFDARVVRHGVGLRSMAERIETLGGTLNVRSGEGAGTTIVGHVPISR